MTMSVSLRNFLLLSSFLAAPALAPSLALAQATPAPAPQTPATAEPERETEVVIVRGRFIPEPQRVTSEVANFLSAADLARTGDDNAAAALTRLTGLSVVSGRFVYVRGLGDRYSSALLNGSPLPSPEPLRRQVPLDLFPSNILSGATVQKTFSPNYPGEFGGGIIDLRTLRSPNEPFMTLKIGTGANSVTTGNESLVHYGHRMDWTGFDTDLRQLPKRVKQAVSVGKRINDNNFTPKELEEIGESFINSPLTVIQREDARPDFEGEFTVGNSLNFGKYNLGLVGVLGYKSGTKTQEALRQDIVADTIEAEGLNLSSTWDIVTNGFGSASLSWDDHRLTATGLLVRSTSKKSQVELGSDTNLPAGQTYRTEGTAWYERQLASFQLSGEHTFGEFDLKWRASAGQSTREAPYERDIAYTVVNGITAFNSATLGNAIRFSKLEDQVLSAGIDGTYKLKIGEGREVELSAGAVYAQTDRESELLSFAFTGPRGPTSQNVLRSRVDFLFSPDNISPARFVITEQTGKDDAYVG